MWNEHGNEWGMKCLGVFQPSVCAGHMSHVTGAVVSCVSYMWWLIHTRYYHSMLYHHLYLMPSLSFCQFHYNLCHPICLHSANKLPRNQDHLLYKHWCITEYNTFYYCKLSTIWTPSLSSSFVPCTQGGTYTPLPLVSTIGKSIFIRVGSKMITVRDCKVGPVYKDHSMG